MLNRSISEISNAVGAYICSQHKATLSQRLKQTPLEEFSFSFSSTLEMIRIYVQLLCCWGMHRICTVFTASDLMPTFLLQLPHTLELLSPLPPSSPANVVFFILCIFNKSCVVHTLRGMPLYVYVFLLVYSCDKTGLFH